MIGGALCFGKSFPDVNESALQVPLVRRCHCATATDEWQDELNNESSRTSSPCFSKNRGGRVFNKPDRNHRLHQIPQSRSRINRLDSGGLSTSVLNFITSLSRDEHSSPCGCGQPPSPATVSNKRSELPTLRPVPRSGCRYQEPRHGLPDLLYHHRGRWGDNLRGLHDLRRNPANVGRFRRISYRSEKPCRKRGIAILPRAWVHRCPVQAPRPV